MTDYKERSCDQCSRRQSKIQFQSEKIYELSQLISKIEQGTQCVYIAHKNCRIDKALGRFINEYPERQEMKIMFLRESEGVYQFGQKRVYIKIEKGDRILVRVGGGYLGIDEFIKTYT